MAEGEAPPSLPDSADRRTQLAVVAFAALIGIWLGRTGGD